MIRRATSSALPGKRQSSEMRVTPDLKKVAIVAGATRGAGRGIAVELGAAGATVYCTGRSVRKTSGRLETIDETADRVNQVGGVGIAIQVDHSQPHWQSNYEAETKRQASSDPRAAS